MSVVLYSSVKTIALTVKKPTIFKCPSRDLEIFVKKHIFLGNYLRNFSSINVILNIIRRILSKNTLHFLLTCFNCIPSPLAWKSLNEDTQILTYLCCGYPYFILSLRFWWIKWAETSSMWLITNTTKQRDIICQWPKQNNFVALVDGLDSIRCARVVSLFLLPKQGTDFNRTENLEKLCILSKHIKQAEN